MKELYQYLDFDIVHQIYKPTVIDWKWPTYFNKHIDFQILAIVILFKLYPL